uniref:GTP-binding protein n=1 Tax=Agarivorans sp. TaxID=1872412 RepID=UPI003CFE3E1E
QAKPQRLLIEPTGLGHPLQIKKRLQELADLGSITIANSLALIDARRLADPRYREHENFAAQLRIADKIIASKADLYQDKDRQALGQYLEQLKLNHKPLLFSQHGGLALDELITSVTQPSRSISFSPISKQQLTIGLETTTAHLDPNANICTLGWSFPASQRFNQQALVDLISSLELLRCKALLQVEQHSLLINQVNGEGTIQLLAPSETNRIELISAQALDRQDLQQQLAACLINNP